MKRSLATRFEAMRTYKPLIITLTCLGVLTFSGCSVQTTPLKGDKGDKGDKGNDGTPGVVDSNTLNQLQSAIAGLETKVDALQAANDSLVGTNTALQAQVTALQASIDSLNAQLNEPNCPIGYALVSKPLVPGNPSSVLCAKGDDEVVKVGGGGSAFWVDRYEASIWENADGSGAVYGTASAGDYPESFSKNGQVALGGTLYAVSKKGVIPAGSMTWFQANVACTASGKRLPTWREWLQAATGTIDPGPNDGTTGACVTNSTGRRQTGAPNVSTDCASIWGAEDMVGNASEWVDQWYAQIVGPSVYDSWPALNYGGDEVVGIGVSACLNGANGGCTTQLPVPMPAYAGGSWYEGVGSGIFAVSLDSSPASWADATGFRCVLSR